MKRAILTLLLMLSIAFAQLATGPEPEGVADEAVRVWLEESEPLDPFALSHLPLEEMCRELRDRSAVIPPPEGTRVNFADRLELERDEAWIVYSYPAAIDDTALGSVRVNVTEAEDGTWQADTIELRLDNTGLALPGFMNSPVSGWLFAFFSLYLLYLTLRPSVFRSWLRQGLEVIGAHRGIVIGTIIVLYGSYALGSLIGLGLPQDCHIAITNVVGAGVAGTGVVDIYATRDVARAAAATALWNFSMGTVITTFIPAYLFAVPAYLINLVRFFILGVALAPVGPTADLLIFHLPVILIELMAYVLVTAGGAMLLVTLIRQGFKGYREGLRKLFLMLPIALVLLVIGAWYEAFELLYLIPAVRGF